MPDYKTDREWSDEFLPRIKQIVGPYLLQPSTFDADTKQATDLMILRGRDMTIAARVRRPGFADKYPFQFTIRSRRDTGAETEWSKVVAGWGDWMFYGHAVLTPDGKHYAGIDPWWLIDLHVFREQLIRWPRRLRTGEIPNGDGTYFRWYDIRTFEPERPILIAAAAHAWPEPDQLFVA